ncbi:MAG: hypothetical protein ACKOHH_02250, partial [Bacteroidota bacterium]
MNLPTIDAALIKVTGVFSYQRMAIPRFVKAGYRSIPLVDDLPPKETTDREAWLEDKIKNAKKFYKDTYYKEFASLMFTGEAEREPMRALQRLETFDLILQKQEKKIKVQCTCQELFLFANETGILSLTISLESLDFESISDIIFCLRSFDSKVLYDNQESELHAFISEILLDNVVKLRGDHVQADDYSGSKFKIYTIINTKESDDGNCYGRDELVYEIGTGSRIGEMQVNGFNAPTQAYYDEIMKNSIKVFRNYTGLALLDSFTVIGQDVYQEREVNSYKFNTYNRVYFSIYIYNLYLRYNIFRFNSIFHLDPIKTRDDFQQFLNQYNYSHISFNFLPNIFYKKIHQALDIDDEVAQFEKRLVGLATRLQEQQEKRQATLLGLISGVTALSSAGDIWNLMEGFRGNLGWTAMAFY